MTGELTPVICVEVCHPLKIACLGEIFEPIAQRPKRAAISIDFFRWDTSEDDRLDFRLFKFYMLSNQRIISF